MYEELKAKLMSLEFDLSNLTVEKINSIRDLILNFTKATFDQVAQLNEDELTFDNVVQPFIDQEILCESSAENHMLFAVMKNVHPDEEVRKAAVAADTAYQQLKVECWLCEDIYKVFDAYYKNNYQTEINVRDIEDQRFVDIKMRNFQRNGLNASPNARQDIKIIFKRIAELENIAQENLASENSTFEYSREQLKGMPETWLKARLLRAGDTEDKDVFKVTLKYPDVQPLLCYADSSDVRKAIYNAFSSRCSATNLPILAELVQLRAKLAGLLGYESFADYAAQVKMAKNYTNIDNFLEKMISNFKDANQKNIEDLTAFAKKESGDQNFELQPWDQTYYIDKHEKFLCNIDYKKISEYFPYSVVENGVMQIYQYVLGLKFVKVDAPHYSYHPDILSYEVFDEDSNTKLGSFILDMFPRPGKYSHNACEELVPGSYKNLPVGILMCNLAKNEGLSFANVRTFFHEFGHLMHIICSRRKLASMSGFNIAIDAVEAPSQMLERWIYDPKALKMLSKHPETGESLPDDIIFKLIKIEKLYLPIAKNKLLVYASFDQRLHQLGEQATPDTILKLYSETKHEISGSPASENDNTPANFGHIYNNQYAATYYGYMWALNIACDMFESVFAKDPMDPSTGKYYRKMFLEPGATKDTDVLIHDFLGREPTPEPFLRYCGIQPMIANSRFTLFQNSLPTAAIEEIQAQTATSAYT